MCVKCPFFKRMKFPLCLFSNPVHPHSRKERERRPQVVRRSAPDSGVLIRLKAQMAEVRSKMSDVKSQVMEVRGYGEPRPGPSGGFSVEDIPSHHADSELTACCKSSELDLLGRAVAARPRQCRPGEHCYNANCVVLIYSYSILCTTCQPSHYQATSTLVSL